MKIKVCGISSPQNMMEVARLGPDYMGFIFYPPSQRFVGDKIRPEQLMQLPSSIKTVGVFVNETIQSVVKIAETFHLAAIQLHGNEPPEMCSTLMAIGYEVIKAFGVKTKTDLIASESYQGKVSAYLFDSRTQQYGGSGETFSWELLKDFTSETPWWVSGGIAPYNLIQALETGCYGLDLNSRYETSPGVKNIDALHQAFSQITLKNLRK